MRLTAPGAVLLALALGGGGCDGVSGQADPWVPWEVVPMPAVASPPDNATTAEKVALGRLLFYDPVLGADGVTACATCHSEIWGMADGLPRSVGVGGGTLTGPGRVGPNVGRRNAQTLWNVGLRGELFWDGRVDTLEAQALAPMHSEVELARAPDAVVAEIASLPEYVERFAAAFPDDPEPLSVTNLTRALAAFERGLVSDRALYDAYVAGDAGAFSDDMVGGMARFAEAGCDACHVPPTFESPRYAARGIGGGEDPGRFEVTGAEADRGAFHVPTLRNVRDSDPYFHDGSVADLEDAVRYELSVADEGFGDEDARLITVFLKKALVDRSREPDRPDTVPSGLPVPEDGFRIPR